MSFIDDESFARLLIFLLIKTFADWTNLDWYSAAILLMGIVFVIGMVVGKLWRGWDLRPWWPWIGGGFFLFTIPALAWWTILGKMPSTTVMAPDVAWWSYDNWWQSLMYFMASSYTHPKCPSRQ